VLQRSKDSLRTPTRKRLFMAPLYEKTARSSPIFTGFVCDRELLSNMPRFSQNDRLLANLG
jgi:hypothetical protein